MTIESDAERLVNPVITAFSKTIKTELEKILITIYISGTAQMTEWAGRKWEGPPMKEAVKWAKERSAQLVTKMDAETKKRLARMISDGIKNKRGIPGLARDIRKTFGDMTKYRSELIARTETANALGESFMVRGKQLGVTGKEWITVGDDRVSLECQENEAAGVIPFNQAFPTGKMTIPQHPMCRCAVGPVMIK